MPTNQIPSSFLTEKIMLPHQRTTLSGLALAMLVICGCENSRTLKLSNSGSVPIDVRTELSGQVRIEEGDQKTFPLSAPIQIGGVEIRSGAPDQLEVENTEQEWVRMSDISGRSGTNILGQGGTAYFKKSDFNKATTFAIGDATFQATWD